MKIQDVIDEVNSTWGEEHEEKRKKIFRENIFWKPLEAFLIVSGLYFCTTFFAWFSLITAPNEMNDGAIFYLKLAFNIPYYLLDIRLGIIVSLASLLLSLYVSVGKFADGVEGAVGDARRAAYRHFAKYVSRIIFAIFVLNFWHALLSVYLQTPHYAPEFLGGMRVSPDWGNLIVPEGISLSRYSEIPLWILLFFAWFTLASSRMLTYSEKDILVKKIYLLRRLNNVSGGKDLLARHVYEVAAEEINSKRTVPTLSSSRKNREQEGYANLFYWDYGYSGFRYKYERRWECVLYGAQFLAIPAFLFLVEYYIGYVVIGIMLFLWEVGIFCVSENCLHGGVYRLNKNFESKYGKFIESWRFYSLRVLFEALRVMLLLAILIAIAVANTQYFVQSAVLVIVFYACRWKNFKRIKHGFYCRLKQDTRARLSEGALALIDEFQKSPGNKECDKPEIVDKTSWRGSGLRLHCVFSIRLEKFPLLMEKIYLWMKATVGFFILDEKKGEECAEYMLIAYVYCLMIRVNESYVEYELESGGNKGGQTSNAVNNLIRYKYSRPATHGSLRRK
ncbi:hypothetical protein [uncultured Rothia sp.]|uniref:hypothetical protein n=1 Tax=uncultured Rothia sp. TaxID=316088 RepID=UPI00288C4962|nr:hypothetical protein [uncultured Rothia sp.]